MSLGEPPDRPVLAVVGMTREAKILVGGAAVVGGGRADVLAARVEAALARGAAGVISFGLCAALDPALQVGDLVIGEAIVDEEGEHRVDPAWAARLAVALPDAKPGRLAGTSRVLSSVAEKAALRQHTDAAAADMESHVAARAARWAGAPFAVLRAVSDGADRALPHAAQVGLGPDGRPALGAVLASLRANPWQIGALIRTALEAEDGFHALERARQVLGPRLAGPS
jgi:adenosylhomocysteine nucleosidase